MVQYAGFFESFDFDVVFDIFQTKPNQIKSHAFFLHPLILRTVFFPDETLKWGEGL